MKANEIDFQDVSGRAKVLKDEFKTLCIEIVEVITKMASCRSETKWII